MRDWGESRVSRTLGKEGEGMGCRRAGMWRKEQAPLQLKPSPPGVAATPGLLREGLGLWATEGRGLGGLGLNLPHAPHTATLGSELPMQQPGRRECQY